MDALNKVIMLLEIIDRLKVYYNISNEDAVNLYNQFEKDDEGVGINNISEKESNKFVKMVTEFYYEVKNG